MVPKLHRNGSSHLAACAYVLHDKDKAKTSNRVAWTSTRNLATRDPHTAARVMASTSMAAETLKREAGVSASGRRSSKTVAHLTLSWHEDEAADLTKEEMLRAADEALKAIGAENHQALIVAHNDEPHPHIHIVLCRISTEDGRMLTLQKSKLKLSRFAQNYEEKRLEQGITDRIYCEERVQNNRDRGRDYKDLYVRAPKDVPRHIFELQKGHDREIWGGKLREEQREKDRAVRQKELELDQRQAEEVTATEAKFVSERASILQKSKRQLTIVRQAVLKDLQPDWAELALEQEQERIQFAERERSIVGKGRNLLRGLKDVKWADLLRSDRRSSVLPEAFGLLAGSKTARSEALRRSQARANLELQKEQEEEIAYALAQERARQAAALQEQRQSFLLNRAMRRAKHAAERADIAKLWQDRKREREQAWEKALRKETTLAFEREATTEEERDEAALKFMGRMRKLRAQKKREREQKKGCDGFERDLGHERGDDD